MSRAEFKLEEVFRRLTVSTLDGPALDVGAAPGGWTRILSLAGAHPIDAVDPGEPHPLINSLDGVSWHRTTIGEFIDTARRNHYSVLVNDMRMEYLLSVDYCCQMFDLLRAGGLVVVTLKINPHDAIKKVAQAVEILGEKYKIVLVKQLFHNRREVTVVCKKERA
ncbi:SAM-dependent methyltransferase [Dermabacter vaginalis]|uniref:SAM-dependent methyltransferase n=1 Tax=Dermabacter vaginalis TaxID=1630135 RepID=UPI0021A48681|nr:SAM-dependent methyltransferase [Dermabacter vaginalis]